MFNSCKYFLVTFFIAIFMTISNGKALATPPLGSPLFTPTASIAGYSVGVDGVTPGWFEWGYSFKMNNTATVTGIGVPSVQFGFLYYSYGIPVGLWSPDGTLLASTVIVAGLIRFNMGISRLARSPPFNYTRGKIM